ncbi:single-stranded DNA-binding protein [Sinosporangium siamense]|uniref:Single-stranded DNA-binding protein n=2 Tax=Sinosporangium siamense TaxID=1367973 RepID=A0A919V656_9ACTN|nr:single-stranded DNA-binding protein [Sinosporangium siamense]GII91651.1 hypothetical protein Ssi02_18820 [Sinosporangium siamense]
MNDIYITLTGNVATEPRQHHFPDGARVTTMRVATASRYFDRRSQEWRSSGTTFFTVRSFRSLGDNVAQSVRLGQPVVVHGRLRIRQYQHEEETRFVAEVEASSVGHDLRWGIGSYMRPHRDERSDHLPAGRPVWAGGDPLDGGGGLASPDSAEPDSSKEVDREGGVEGKISSGSSGSQVGIIEFRAAGEAAETDVPPGRRGAGEMLGDDRAA